MYRSHSPSESDEPQSYSCAAVNSGWPPFGEEEEMHSIQESDHGKRNHLLTTDVIRLSVMLLGNSLDTRHFPVRIIQQALFKDGSNEGGADWGECEEMRTMGQVTRNHHTQPTTFLPSRLRQPFVFQLVEVREHGNVYQEGGGIIRWKFGFQDLFLTDNTTVKIVSSPSVQVLNQPSEQMFFRLYLDSDGARFKAQNAAFFIMMMAGSRFYNSRISVTLRNSHLRSIQLVRDCDISIGRSDISVKAVCGCGDFVSMDIMKQSAKAGIVCLDIQFL